MVHRLVEYGLRTRRATKTLGALGWRLFVDRPLLSRALNHWGIRSFRIVASLGGSGNVWAIHTGESIHVLKRATDQGDYLDYQLAVIKQLRNSGFPYAVPAVIPTEAGLDYVESGRDSWTLYSFLPGTPAPPLPDLQQSKSLGTLVAHFHEAASGVGRELGITYGTEIFEIGEVISALYDGADWISLNRNESELQRLLQENCERIVRTLREIPLERITETAKLPKCTIYNDWHCWNIIALDGNIVGLVDYDSLVEAPRIVDFQNALTYVLINNNIPPLDLIRAFSSGYKCVVRLSVGEISLVYFVMLYRIAWHIADILKKVRADGKRSRDGLAIGFINCFSWLSENADVFLRELSVVGPRTTD